MDRNSPASYIEPSASASLSDTQSLITHIRSLPSSPSASSLVQPILTPRFAISCTPTLLRSLGDLAAEDSTLMIQTHISENRAEVEFTKELFKHEKGCETYAGVYDHFGLLREKTILAHGCLLEETLIQFRGWAADQDAQRRNKPLSNLKLQSQKWNSVSWRVYRSRNQGLPFQFPSSPFLAQWYG
jgi:guanine deaminase